jgi:hypothetical protein
MQFATKSLGGSNGQAALALMSGLIGVLFAQDVLDKADLAAVFNAALRELPSQPNARDTEARDLVNSLRAGIGV